MPTITLPSSTLLKQWIKEEVDRRERHVYKMMNKLIQRMIRLEETMIAYEKAWSKKRRYFK